jgi:four helix bundle protein
MQNFRELLVWQKAHSLTLEVYKMSRALPAEERYSLTSQIRRSAASIGSNLAEGCGRGTTPDMIQFVQIAFGSSSELSYQLLLARDLGYIAPVLHESLEARVQELQRMMGGLLTTLRKHAGRARPPRRDPASRQTAGADQSTNPLIH